MAFGRLGVLVAFLFFLIAPLTVSGSVKLVIHKADVTKGSRYSAFSRRLRGSEITVQAVDRLTFGPRPGESSEVELLGLRKWLDLQLHPEKVPESPVLAAKLAPYKSLEMSAHDIFVSYSPPRLIGAPIRGKEASPGDPEDEPGQRTKLLSPAPRQVILTELTSAKILRAAYSDHQLEEELVDFWFNHFNVFFNKGADRYLLTGYERDAIRPHVLGKFYDLLLATAQSPAMLFYLDNAESVSPTASVRAGAQKRVKRGLNENYGRELMELHTLGVNGGYTQKDVIEVARCFTGWTISPPRGGSVFEFNAKAHDYRQKVVLGHLIRAGGGMEDGMKVLQILAGSSQTAHHISLELAQRFVSDDPPPSLVDRMAATYSKTNGDLREVMRTMIFSPEFFSEGAYRAKVKTPFEMVISAVRAANADIESPLALSQQIAQLGEPLYRKIEPAGYSNANPEWINSASLLGRINFSVALANNRIPGVRLKQGSGEQLAETLGSPEFQYR